MDGMMPPATVDPTVSAEDARQRVAKALMLQRGMGRQTPMGTFANSALQALTMMGKPTVVAGG